MARKTFDLIKPLLLRHEGGYVDHPRDPGGATNYGITIATLSSWRGQPVSKTDVRNLTKEEAIAIYKARYWDTICGDDLPSGLDYAVYDYSVNSGPGRAAKELQRVVGAKVDGAVGPMTLAAVRECGKTPEQMVVEICDRRLVFMKRLRTWGTFGKGWSRRVCEVKDKGVSLASSASKVPLTNEQPEKEQNAPAVADDIAATEAWKTPQGVATGVSAVSGIGAILSGSGPLQWALALVIVIAGGVGAYYVLKQIREEDG